MLTTKQFDDLAKNGITFELSANGKFANIYNKGKFVSSIFAKKNAVFFCGKKFVETTTKDIIDFLCQTRTEPPSKKTFTNDEIFAIWKRCITENRTSKSFEIELSTNEYYLYNYFKKLHLPDSFRQRNLLDKELLKNLLAQNYYENAKKFLE